MSRIFLIGAATMLLSAPSAASPTLPKSMTRAAKAKAPASPVIRNVKVGSVAKEEPKGMGAKAFIAGLCSEHIGPREVCVSTEQDRIHAQEGVIADFMSHVAFESRTALRDAATVEHVARLSVWIFGTIVGATDKTSYDCEYRVMDDRPDVSAIFHESRKLPRDRQVFGYTIRFICLEQNGPPGARLMIIRDTPPQPE